MRDSPVDSRRGVEYQSLVRKKLQRVLRRPQAVVIVREHRSRGRWGGNAFDLNTSDERKLASRHAAIEVNADVLLIPDCGCGVFRNDPEEVGECLGYALEGARSQSELRTSGSETLGRRQRPGRLLQGGGPCRLRCFCDGCDQGVGEVSTGPGTSVPGERVCFAHSLVGHIHRGKGRKEEALSHLQQELPEMHYLLPPQLPASAGPWSQGPSFLGARKPGTPCHSGV